MKFINKGRGHQLRKDRKKTKVVVTKGDGSRNNLAVKDGDDDDPRLSLAKDILDLCHGTRWIPRPYI